MKKSKPLKKENFFLSKIIEINDKPKRKKESIQLTYKTEKRKGKNGKIKKIKTVTGRKKIEYKKDLDSTFTVKEKIFKTREQAEKFFNSELKKFNKNKAKNKNKKFLGSVQIGLGKAKITKKGFNFEGELSKSGKLKSVNNRTNILTSKNNLIRMFDDAEKSFEEYTIELVKVKTKKKLKNGKNYYWKRLVKSNDGKRIKINQTKLKGKKNEN